MNDACNVPVTKHTKKVTGKPNVPKNKATVGTMDTSVFRNIDPSATPVSAYTKKTK